MLVFADNITPRLKYVLNFIFRDVLETDASHTDDPDLFCKHKGAKINYSSLDQKDSFRIPVSGLLDAGSIEDVDPGPEFREAYPVLFIHTEASGGSVPDESIYDMDFDIFAAVFYMISRYEEYLPFEPDEHGRFAAEDSLAAKNGFLEIPVADMWIKDLGDALHLSYPEFMIPETSFRFLPTSDVDLPYAYLHRGRARTIGARVIAGFRKLDDQEMRKAVLSGKERDPFDTFREIEAIHALHNLRPVIFFLTSRYGRFDKSISPESKAFRELVKHTRMYADTGIHPSYRASENHGELKKEIRTLSNITGEKITRSRQHFLKFSLPGSYRNYLREGIQEEYSMGFASRAGFRAGTSRPHFFYNLENEEETSLRIIPFQVMDRTMKDYMSLSPEQALEKILALAGAVRTYGGTFVSIWHNDAFSDFGEWKGWKDVYLQMTDTLANWSGT